MSDGQLVVGKLPKGNLTEIAKDVGDNELACALKGLSVHAGSNYAIYEMTDDTPTKPIRILPSPAVGPANSTKICEGRLVVGGIEIPVTAFRLP